jgi:ABC-type Fe3+-siderophore transport system permease subunit
MNEEILIPVTFFGSLFGIAYVYLTTRNRERMAMIEKGADPSLFRNPVRGRSFFTLKFGLLFVGVSLGILMGALLAAANIRGLEEEPASFAMMFLFGGIALIISHFLEEKKRSQKDATPHDPK